MRILHKTCHCETSANTGCGNPFSLTLLKSQCFWDTDSHTSDIGHWFGMTDLCIMAIMLQPLFLSSDMREFLFFGIFFAFAIMLSLLFDLVGNIVYT